jgi:hypothetical protein
VPEPGRSDEIDSAASYTSTCRSHGVTGFSAPTPATGGAVNPVRALGPALIAGQLPNIWIYIVGPLLGGVAAAFVYDRFLAKAQAPA